MTQFTTWIKSHKKLTLTIIAGLFLIIFIIISLFQITKKRFFPTSTPSESPLTTMLQDSSKASMLIKIPKDTYSLSEKIPIVVQASSQNNSVTGFDIAIQYDPQMVTITPRKFPILKDFDYFGKTKGGLITISAVQKIDSPASQIFKNTTLFELEFTPKAIGKTSFKMIFSPNSTSESNILDQNSSDILGNVLGKEITITN